VTAVRVSELNRQSKGLVPTRDFFKEAFAALATVLDQNTGYVVPSLEEA